MFYKNHSKIVLSKIEFIMSLDGGFVPMVVQAAVPNAIDKRKASI